jgi:hypothetical protein
MRGCRLNTVWLLLLAGIFLVGEGCRPRGAEPREHRRMWRKWSKKSDAFNPYVKHGKSTHEISRREKREDDKALKRAKREYKKGIRRSARKRGGK